MQFATLFATGLAAGLSITSSAMADLIVGDPLTVIGQIEGTDIMWGTGINGGREHPFGGVTEYFEKDGPITVSSFSLKPPPGHSAAGMLIMDFSESMLPFFHLTDIFIIDIHGIKSPGDGHYIDFVDGHNATTDGYSINLLSIGIAIKGPDVLEVVWTQIPGPSGLTLLGLAGFAWPRRRRSTGQVLSTVQGASA